MPAFPYNVEPFPSTSTPAATPPKDVNVPASNDCSELSHIDTEIEYQCDNNIEYLVKTVDITEGEAIAGDTAHCRLTRSINTYKIAVGPCRNGVRYPEKPPLGRKGVLLVRFEKLEAEIAKRKADGR